MLNLQHDFFALYPRIMKWRRAIESGRVDVKERCYDTRREKIQPGILNVKMIIAMLSIFPKRTNFMHYGCEKHWVCNVYVCIRWLNRQIDRHQRQHSSPILLYFHLIFSLSLSLAFHSLVRAPFGVGPICSEMLMILLLLLFVSRFSNPLFSLSINYTSSIRYRVLKLTCSVNHFYLN